MHGHYRPASDLGYLVAADGKYEDRYSNLISTTTTFGLTFLNAKPGTFW
ncbi:MAG: hypothetical protein R2792_09695 [Saprospiraceae bacterium]